MNFQWDPAKNKENIRKHFLDFSDAHEIFDGPMLVAIDDRFDYGEAQNDGDRRFAKFGCRDRFY